MTLTDDVEPAINAKGFVLLGALKAPAPAQGGQFLLIGNAGPLMWETFIIDRTGPNDRLDRWTNETLQGIADDLGLLCSFPNDGPPWHPFQHWGEQTGHIFPSPLGIQIHKKYGLWFAYRAAFHLGEELEASAAPEVSACESCPDQPCRTACPVSAIGQGTYEVPKCIDHIRSDAGRDCLNLGCQARHACPVGREFVYEPAQARFHMQAFLKANG